MWGGGPPRKNYFLRSERILKMPDVRSATLPEVEVLPRCISFVAFVKSKLPRVVKAFKTPLTLLSLTRLDEPEINPEE